MNIFRKIFSKFLEHFENFRKVEDRAKKFFTFEGVISGLPPTHFIGEKPPSKVKLQSALECLGDYLELRFKKFPSILDPEKCVEINWIGLSCKLTPTEVKNFLARFSTLRNFFKMFQNTKIAEIYQGPNSTYSSIWVKKNLRVRKSRKLHISRPLKWFFTKFYQAIFEKPIISDFVRFLKCPQVEIEKIGSYPPFIILLDGKKRLSIS